MDDQKSIPTCSQGIFIGFDFGLRNIGLAVGQKITKTASPLSPLKAKNGIPKWDEIAKVIQEWKPEALVVGVPLTMEGDELKITKRAKTFIASLEERFNLPVYAADEVLTTKSAKALIFNKGGYKALQKISWDSVAAKFILEGWMDINNG